MRADLRESRCCQVLCHLLGVVVLTVVRTSSLHAQTLTNPGPVPAGTLLPTPSADPPPAGTATGPVSLSEVVSLSKAGLSDDVIAGLIRQRGGVSTLSVEQLVYLRQQGVSNEVIKSMQNAAPPAKPVAAAPAPTVAPVASVAPTPTTTIAAPPTVTTYQVQPQPTVVVQPAPVVVRPYPYYWEPYCYPHYHHHPVHWNFGYHGGHRGHGHWSFGLSGW